MMNKRSIFALFLLFSLAMMSLSRESNSYRVHEYHSGKVARICDSLFLVSVCKKLTTQRRKKNIILKFFLQYISMKILSFESAILQFFVHFSVISISYLAK